MNRSGLRLSHRLSRFILHLDSFSSARDSESQQDRLQPVNTPHCAHEAHVAEWERGWRSGQRIS
jgi:hypothetical protein